MLLKVSRELSLISSGVTAGYGLLAISERSYDVAPGSLRYFLDALYAAILSYSLILSIPKSLAIS